MGFFGRLLRRKNSDTDIKQIANASASLVPPASSPTSVGFDPQLVHSLQEDHANMGALYASIGELHTQGNQAEFQKTLAQLKALLQSHVLKENVRFYNYLEQSLSEQDTEYQLLRDFRRDMNGIVRQVLAFIDTWQSPAASQRTTEQFQTDYQAILALLEQRFDNEENRLYPMYQPRS